MEKEIIQAPALDIDALMLNRYGRKVSANGKLERRIVANLIAYMDQNDWKVAGVHDGDVYAKVNDMKAAMELIFNLDEAGLYFAKGKSHHCVYLVLGNGIDIICDWYYAKDDADGFGTLLTQFDAEDYA